MIKILITGPESSGKSTLAEDLAREFNAEYVPEFARQYLNENGPSYEQSDLDRISEGQRILESKAKGRIVICDTGQEVIRIWSKWKYGNVSEVIENNLRSSKYDLVLLCRPDIPWEADDLRESPHHRDALFTLFRELLDRLKWRYLVVEGNRDVAIARVKEIIEEMGNGKH